MKRSARILSIILVICMLIGLIPAYASAARTMDFSDVRSNQWFYDSIKYVYEAGMMNGTDTTKFSPDQATTRGMLVTILYRLEGSPEVEGRCPFNDVGSNLYYRDPIVWASENGLVNGYSATTFGPDNILTREQMATIMYRYSRYKAYSTLDEGDYTIYEDGDRVGVWSEDAMRWAIGSGLISGVSDRYLQPGGSATRAQIATVLMRYCENIVAPAGQCRVTFVRNDGTDGAYKMNVVAVGNTVAEPADPTRDQYGFTGWYRDAACAEAFDFDTPISHNLTLYAGWSAPDGQDGLYSVAPGEDTIYSITGMEMVDGSIEVTINADSTSVLVVEFLDEDYGYEICTVSSQTPRYCEMTVISIPVEEDLPEHFSISAQLFDLAGNELTDKVSCPKYTSAYEEFESLNVSDFEDQRVLQFTESETDNFGVLSDGVIEIESTDEKNLLSVYEMSTYSVDSGLGTQDNKVYVFESPDATVLNLAEDDAVLAKDINGVDYLFKVGSIEEDAGTIMIMPATDTEMNEFYDVLKVNTEIEVKDLEPERTNTMAEIANIDGSWSASAGIPFDIDLDTLELSGHFKLTGTIDLEITYNAHLFSRDYVYCSVVSETQTEFEANLVAKVESPDAEELELPKTPIPTPVPGLSLYMQPQLPMEWEISGGGNFTYTNSIKSGFIYDSNSGVQTVDEKTQAISFGLKGSAELKIGPKVAFGVSLVKVVEAEINLHAGIKVSATAESSLDWTDAESKHACALCIDGECKWFATVSAELNVFDITILEAELINVEGWMNFLKSCPGKFHFSVINSADSIYGGRPHFGGGECQNVQWRTTIYTKGKNDNLLTGISVGIDKHNSSFYKTGTSTVTTYLYNGMYDLRANIEGQWVTKSLNVNQAAQSTTLKPDVEDGGIKGKVSDSETRAAISGASVLATQNGTVIKSTVTNSNGDYSMTLPSGTYFIEIQKNGYNTFDTVVTVTDSETYHMQTALLVKEDQKMGGFAGTITDAVTGDFVEDVRLEIRKGWDNTSEGDIIDVLYTNYWGEFEYETFELFGVTIGLPAGNYTLNASKDGYVDMSFNVVIRADMTIYNQDAAISPEMSNEVYRVVLRWGDIPSDLDSHLNAVTDSGYREHIFYSDRDGYAGNLDRDDTDYEGPETITITNMDYYDGGFTYSIHDYSNRRNTNSYDLSQSGAYITIYRGSNILRTINVPYNRVGNVWNVFSISENGTIRILNTFENIEDPDDVGSRYVF